MIPHRQLLPLRVVADQLGVHHKTLRKWISQGRVPAYRVAGHALRLDPAEVQEALLRPTTSTTRPGAAARAVERLGPPRPVSVAERAARMQATARRRGKRATS